MLFGFICTAQPDSFFKKADLFFKAYVTDGSVKYKEITSKPSELNELIKYISNADVKSFSEKEAKAFFLNAYNLLVISSIVKAYPVNSPMDVEGFFDKKKQSIGGEQLTLNNIENKKIREVYEDSRIHFALVCAAKGCPKIADFAFTPENVENQLEKLTINAMNNPDFTKIDVKEKKVMLSEIFNWYKQDFLAEAPDLLSYVNQYRNKKIDKSFKVGHYTYNWELNEATMNN